MGVLDSYIQLGIESAWGTERSNNFAKTPVKDYDVIPELETFLSEMQVGAAGAPAVYNGAVINDGSYVGELTYNSCDWLYYGVLGQMAQTGNGTTTAYQRIFSPGTSIPSWTIQKCLGNVPSAKVFTDLGVKVKAVELAADFAAGIGVVSAELTSKKEKGTAGGDTPTATGLVTISPVPVQLAGEATIWNPGQHDTNYCVLGMRLRIDRRLGRGPVCAGSVTPKEPQLSKTLEVTATFRVLWDSHLLYEAFKATTTDITNARIKWVGPTTGIGSDFNTVDIKLNRARMTKALAPIRGGADYVEAEVVLKGFGIADGDTTAETGDEPLSITTINANAGTHLA